MTNKTTLALALAALSACPLWGQLAPPPTPAPAGQPPLLSQRPQVTFLGSVSSGEPTAGELKLTLRDAIQRGLKYNLGVLVNQDAADLAATDHRRVLAALLPQVFVGVTQNSAQNDLVAFGLSFQNPSFSIPSVVGPFGYQNARVYAQETVYDRPALRTLKSAAESLKAARLSAEDARNVVVQAVSNAYLTVITDAARADAIVAEVDTARTLLERAQDQKAAGTVPGIDVLRAEVQFRTEQQRLLAEQNQVAKDKLSLARAIGLPPAQRFSVTDSLPYADLTPSYDDLLKQAYERRADYRSAQAAVRAAELAVDSARAENWPSVVVQGDYGDVGTTFANSHGTYSLVAGVHIPIYTGGKQQVDIDQASTVLRTRRNAVSELRGRIDFEIRSALLDLQSAAAQVAVAKRSVELAAETLAQAKDRFAAGVTDNLEVVQAQQSLASANENYIAAIGAHNAAKIALATSAGVAEEGIPQYLNLKP